MRHFENLNESELSSLAERLGDQCGPACVILLDGQVGAGKTHFARAMIQHLLAQINGAEDVPSPTFTLVQTYDAEAFEIWHADLYRLSSLDEVYELGLEDAFETGLCLVEWPDRLGSLAPKSALKLTIKIPHPDARSVTMEWTAPKWDAIVAKL